jgi:hypothetical protein
MTIGELIESKNIPDDRQFEVPLSDGNKATLTLKDLREHVRTIHGDVAAREEAVATLLAAASQPAPQPAATVPRETVPAPNEFNYASDPLFGPLVRRLDEAERRDQQIIQHLTQMGNGTAQQIAAAIDLEYRNAFESTKDRYPGVNYDQAMRHARDNHIMNARGILDPLRAAHELSADARMEAVKKAEYARGQADRQKELDEAARAQGVAAIALPGMSRAQGDQVFKPKPQLGLQGNIKEGLRQAFAGLGRTA